VGGRRGGERGREGGTYACNGLARVDEDLLLRCKPRIFNERESSESSNAPRDNAGPAQSLWVRVPANSAASRIHGGEERSDRSPVQRKQQLVGALGIHTERVSGGADAEGERAPDEKQAQATWNGQWRLVLLLDLSVNSRSCCTLLYALGIVWLLTKLNCMILTECLIEFCD